MFKIIEGELSACALGLECGEKEREDKERFQTIAGTVYKSDEGNLYLMGTFE